MKFNSLILLPIAFIILVLAIPHKQKSSFESFGAPSSLHDSLPASYLENVKASEIQGYKIQNQPGRTTFYYEYKADHKQVLTELSALPFPVDSLRADLHCQAITHLSELKQVESLLKDERVAGIFNLPEPIENYLIYQCIKTDQHFVLLHKNSSNVIHIIQQG